MPEVAVDWARSNVLWALGIAPLALAATQILIAAGGDPATLRVLIQNADPVKVLLGSVLPVLPIALLGLGPYYIERRIRGESVPKWWGTASPVIVGLSALTLPSDWFGGLVFIYASMVGVAYEWHRRRKGKDSVRVYNPLWFLFVVVVIMAGVAGPWMSAEVVEVRGGAPVIAYVVDEKGPWTTLLRYGGGVEVIHSVDVTAKTVCNKRIRGRSTVAALLHWPDRNPLCDDIVRGLKNRTPQPPAHA